MAENIISKNANDVWKIAINKLLETQDTVSGRTGNTFELLHTFITIEDPRQKWIYDRVPPMSIAYALAELVWIINGDDRADIINYWNPSLEKYAGKSEYYHGAYGKRIRSHFGFDQLEKAYYALKNNPETRQVVLQIYDTSIDFPVNQGQPQDDDIPCNICSLIKIRNEKLEWSQIMRSNDILLGMPYNFVQFTGLQEILAGWLNLEVGTYNHYSDSLHLYQRDIEKLEMVQGDIIQNADSLSIPKKDSESIFKEMYERMKFLGTKKVTEPELYFLSELNSDYVAYNNMMRVIVAYVAYKHQKYKIVSDLMDMCNNQLYCRIWNRWIKSRDESLYYNEYK